MRETMATAKVHKAGLLKNQMKILARVTFGRELMLTPRLGIFGEAEYDIHEDWSYQGGASYWLSQSFSATALWDSVYGVGAGITFRF